MYSKWFEFKYVHMSVNTSNLQAKPAELVSVTSLRQAMGISEAPSSNLPTPPSPTPPARDPSIAPQDSSMEKPPQAHDPQIVEPPQEQDPPIEGPPNLSTS